MKFLHIADVHLGCRRYNLDERARDFFRAWYDVLQRYALPNRPDFVLIAGDLFHMRRVDPQTMNHAIAGLELLRSKNIPVLVIEGNHDQSDPTSHFSWLRSLSQWGYLKLLEPQYDESKKLIVTEWDEKRRRGSFIDIGGARIFGSNWYGMSANAVLPLLAEQIKPHISSERFNILMLHTDIEGYLKRPIPALTQARLRELRGMIDYVALGHTHKEFNFDNWAFNPGSLEACTVDEYDEPRGFYMVEVRDHKAEAQHIRDYVQRPIQRLSVEISGSADPEMVRARILELVEREARVHDESSGELAPIVEVTLRGRLGFRTSLLETNALREQIQERTRALHVIIRNLTIPVEYQVGDQFDPSLPRHERERRILEDLVTRDARYRDRAGDVANLIMEAKRLALEEEAPERIIEFIAQKLGLESDDDGANVQNGVEESIADSRLVLFGPRRRIDHE
ncbi:MAG: DNA repair exonuclease [Pyrinomonas sp.]|uniref:metallophosphoesterase family protein n=1 Tax=Pyrinomonas sp. TaxID=2080306 RepID=UPI00332FAED9